MTAPSASPAEAPELTETAATKVFAIPELCEMILLELVKTVRPWVLGLFPLQRVSRTFRKTLTDSPSLRRGMFLDPLSSEEVISEGIRDPLEVMVITVGFTRFVPTAAVRADSVRIYHATNSGTGARIELDIVNDGHQDNCRTRKESSLRCDGLNATWQNIIAMQVPAGQNITLQLDTCVLGHSQRSVGKANTHFQYTLNDSTITLGGIASFIDECYSRYATEMAAVDAFGRTQLRERDVTLLKDNEWSVGTETWGRRVVRWG